MSEDMQKLVITLTELLCCTELNRDDLEPETSSAICRANDVLTELLGADGNPKITCKFCGYCDKELCRELGDGENSCFECQSLIDIGIKPD